MKTRLFAVVALSFLLSACIPTIGSSSPGASKDEFKKGAYVTGFPAVPFYKNSKVIESYGFQGKFGSASVTNDDITKVTKFFDESLKPLGWDYSVRQNSATSFEYSINNSKQQGSIIVNTTVDGKKTGITVSVAPR